MDKLFKYANSNIIVAMRKLEGYMENKKNTPAEVREKVSDLIEKEIELIKHNIRHNVTDSLKNAQIEFLNAIKNIDDLTETEFEILVKAYGSNYYCCKALKQIADKNKITFNILTLDERMAMVDELKTAALNIINKYKPGTGAVDVTELVELLAAIYENGFIVSL